MATLTERQLVRKIDIRLVPIVFLLYMLNYVDRNNIGNARIAGMETDLHLHGQDFATVLSILTVSYMLFEVPSNMILARTRPSRYIPALCILWGYILLPPKSIDTAKLVCTTAALMSLSTSRNILIIFRLLLGLFESGFFPGIILVIASWYTRKEVAVRFALFLCASILSGAFGGLLAGGITSSLDNVRGLRGWRWLFVVEGLITISAAFLALFILPDFPESESTKRWLGAENQELLITRLRDAAPVEQEVERKWASFVSAVTDWRTWGFAIHYLFVISSASMVAFIPTIVEALGYSAVTTQYMTIPIYVIAATVSVIVAILVGRRNTQTGLPLLATLGLGFFAAIMETQVTGRGARYTMLTLLCIGVWSTSPLCFAWASQRIRGGRGKKAVALAIMNTMGNLSNLFGTRVWPDWSRPRYVVGFGAVAGFFGGALLMTAFMIFRLRGKDEEEEDGLPVVEGIRGRNSIEGAQSKES